MERKKGNDEWAALSFHSTDKTSFFFGSLGLILIVIVRSCNSPVVVDDDEGVSGVGNLILAGGCKITYTCERIRFRASLCMAGISHLLWWWEWTFTAHVSTRFSINHAPSVAAIIGKKRNVHSRSVVITGQTNWSTWEAGSKISVSSSSSGILFSD